MKWKQGKKNKPPHFNLITQVVTRTLNGLIGPQYLKGDIAITAGRKTIGEISSKDVNEFQKTKPYHNVVRELSAGKDGPAPKDAEHRRMGAIAINSLYFFSDDELTGGLIALIHEATHKYAGTQDEFYVNEEFVKRKNDNTFQGKSNAKAIVNADSYRVPAPGLSQPGEDAISFEVFRNTRSRLFPRWSRSLTQSSRPMPNPSSPEKRCANRSIKERLYGSNFGSPSNSKNSTMSSGGSILALANSSLSCSMSVLSFPVTASRWPSDNS